MRVIPVFYFVVISPQKKQKIMITWEVCVTVGLSSEVCLLPTSKISKTQYFLIIYACKHIILGTINTTIFLCVINFMQICVSWNLEKKYRGSPKFQKSRIFLGPPKFTIFTKIVDRLFWNSRELWSSQCVKMQEYMCFPKSSRPNSNFSPKNVDHNF